jgi:AraC-like DNA-binding protein
MDNMTSSSGVPAFTYAGPQRGRDYESWREEFCRLFCQLDAEPTTQGRIECTVEVTRIGSLSFGAAHGTSGSFLRSRDLLVDGCDDFVLIMASAGKVLTVQRGNTIELQPSQMCLLALDNVGECGLGNGGRYTALRIPRRDLLAVCRESEDKISKLLITSPSLRDAVTGYFALCTKTAASVDAVTQDVMARHMTELVGLLLRSESDETPPAPQNSYGAARLRLIQAQALRHLQDTDLTIGSVAQRAGLTPKQVQRLFGTSGITFAEFVLEQRLLLSCKMLSASGRQLEKIGSIAQDAGFSDLSYFNRSFRKRFETTPSEWRAARTGHVAQAAIDPLGGAVR